MENALNIDVAALDAPHRRALEEVIGQQLAVHQQIFICVTDKDLASSLDRRPPQTMADWTKIYDGLSDEQIEQIDQIANTRANLTRDFP